MSENEKNENLDNEQPQPTEVPAESPAPAVEPAPSCHTERSAEGTESKDLAATATAEPEAPAQLDAPLNPFASLSSQAASAATPAVSETPAWASPQKAEPATTSYAPYAVGQVAVAQPQQPQSVPVQPQQTYYNAYGATPQQTVPPTVPPVTPPVQNIYPGYEPPNPNQKRRWPWFLLGLFVGIIIGMGGCAGCVGCMALAGYDTYDRSFGGYDDDRYFNYDFDNDNLYAYPPEDNYQLYDEDDLSGFGSFTYDEILDMFAAEGLVPGTPDEGDVCAPGIYQVGRRGDIPAGLYFLEGSNEKLSHFYVFEPGDTSSTYHWGDGVQYFGTYFADFDEGEIVVFMPGEDVDMYPAPSTSIDPQIPYINGCYRVGIDIPAGTYTVTAYEVGVGETDEDSAAYVMDNLDWEDDSVVDVRFVIPGGKQTITVEDGQYLELFAAQAVPADQA